MAESLNGLPYFYGELFFMNKLGRKYRNKDPKAPVAYARSEIGETVSMGDTTKEQRRERIRAAIIDADLADRIMWRLTDHEAGVSKFETWRSAFQRLFGMPLVPDDLPTEGELL